MEDFLAEIHPFWGEARHTGEQRAVDREVSSTMRVRQSVAIIESLSWLGRAAAVGAIVVLAGCSGAGDSGLRELSVSTQPPSTVSASGETEDGLRAPGATLPQVEGEAAVPFDSEKLVSTTDPAVAAVVARTCTGGVVPATAFAIDEHHFVTVASSLAEDGSDPAKGIDPEPWLHLGSGDWVRGKVVGVSKSPNLAVIEIKTSVQRSLGWAENRPKADEWSAVVGYAARSHGGSDLLATKVIGPAGDDEQLPMVAGKAAAAGRSGPGHMGAPLVNGEGQVEGMVILTDGQGDSMVIQEAAIMRDLAEGLIETPQKISTSCKADAKQRLKVGWGLLLDRDGSEIDAALLGGREALAKHGRVGVVDPSLPSFVIGGASTAIVLGPFGSEKQAQSARKPVGAALAKLDLADNADVMLVPWDTFPAAPPPPPPPTTIPVAAPTTLPPTTAAPTTTKRSSTTAPSGTDERASSGDCSGSRTVRVISGAPPGYSYHMRSGPSKGAPSVALGANGRQVSVVNGSATNGFVKIALPDGRCLWGSSQYLG